MIILLRRRGLELTLLEHENVVPSVDMDSSPGSIERWTELVGEEIKERSNALKACSESDATDATAASVHATCTTTHNDTLYFLHTTKNCKQHI